MTDIQGNGTQGKRLWVRSPDGRWIPPPVCAGEDSNLRSLNIRSASKWLVPVSRNDVTQSRSLHLRAPGREWDNASRENNTYIFNDDQPYDNTNHDPAPSNYIRLSYVQARSDPTWRIVEIDTFMKPAPFSTWPGSLPPYGPYLVAGAGAQYGMESATWYGTPQLDEDGLESSSRRRFDPDEIYPASVLDMCSVYQSREAPLINPGPSAPNYYELDGPYRERYRQSLIDLQYLRAVLEQRHMENNDYVGQLDPLSEQAVKRIVLEGLLSIRLDIHPADEAVPPLPEPHIYWNETRWILKAHKGAPSAHPYGQSDHERYPTLVATPMGESFVVQQGIGGVTQENFTPGLRGARLKRRTLERFFRVVIEDPGEDGVGIHAFVDYAPYPGRYPLKIQHYYHEDQVDGFYPHKVETTMSFRPYYAYVHYASDGYDVPSNLIPAEYGTGLTVG